MKLPCKVIFFAIILIQGADVFAQQKGNKPGTELSIRKATGPIILDGKLDEQDWKDASVATNFFLNYPVDTTASPFQTEARLTFDEHALYVSFVCYDDKTPDVVQSLRRDFDYGTNDNVTLILGPYNDAINGFYFVISPQGVQLEGTISGAGADDGGYNPTWDNKWYSKVVKSEDRWVAELMIPFKSFRFKSNIPAWNITFQRYDLKRNLVSSWIATPIQFFGTSFAYSGKLIWTDHPPHHATNISLIPYVAGGTTRDNATDPATKTTDLQTGFDAKVAVTPSLNLDLTVNPDFSQVEVDRQVINLTRFEFQFPERRQFFLENSDLFERMGWPTARPFFSRRIGLAKDSTGLYKKVPIAYGARLSGSFAGKWRMSMLNMQTNEKLSLGLPSQNFTVVAIQRNFWKQSNIQLSFVNKVSLGVGRGDTAKYFNQDLWKDKVVGGDTTRVLNDFNRVATLDVETRSVDNTWYSSVYLSQSFDSFTTSDRLTGGGFVQYTKRNLNIAAGQTWLQKNYNSEAGFVPNHGVYPGVANSFASIYATFYPPKSRVARMGPGLDLNLNVIPGGIVVDKNAALQYNINFLSTANFQVSYLYNYQEMTNKFNPIDGEKYTNYLPGERYTWNRYSIQFQSNQRKLFRYTLGAATGGFYNGDNLNFNGELNLRYQPYGSVSVRFDYNDLKLPGNYGSEKLFVVSPRFDLTFTSKIFLTTFVQYNTLLENVNLNARLQWRYKPASDFFVVYTENYLPETFGSKNRALVFKFTYWLNI
jgi:hypothetical protein